MTNFELAPPDYPASDRAKTQLAALARNISHRGFYWPRLPLIDDPPSYLAPIFGEQIQGYIAWHPEGMLGDPSLKGLLRLGALANAGGIVDVYNIRQIPDGWDIEKHPRLTLSSEPAIRHMETVTADDVRTMIAALDTRLENTKRAEQMARELGLAAISEGEAQDLIGLLRSQPRQPI